MISEIIYPKNKKDVLNESDEVQIEFSRDDIIDFFESLTEDDLFNSFHAVVESFDLNIIDEDRVLDESENKDIYSLMMERIFQKTALAQKKKVQRQYKKNKKKIDFKKYKLKLKRGQKRCKGTDMTYSMKTNSCTKKDRKLSKIAKAVAKTRGK